jgi:hypothetical protein
LKEEAVNEDREWVYNKWAEIDARVNKAEEDLHRSEELAKQLLVDIEFLRMMFEEDLI